MPAKTRKLPEKKDVGALVFIFAQTDGQFGIVSTDREVEAWGRSLDDCWPRYFTKATRAMRRREREMAAAAKAVPAGAGSFDGTPNASDEGLRAAQPDEGGFTEV